MNKYKINVYDIEYCIEPEDIEDIDDESSDDIIIEKIKKSLPQKLEFYIDCEEDDDLEELICDKISDLTGWLMENYSYDIQDEGDDK